VLRFIRDGKLTATKIGKAYRIRRSDLDALAGTPTPAAPVVDTARVTAVVDVPGVGPGLAAKLGGAVTDALHGGRGGRGGRGDVHAEVIHDRQEEVLKVIVVGSVADTSDLLGLLQVWLEQITP
jgi:hypothetical protein